MPLAGVGQPAYAVEELRVTAAGRERHVERRTRALATAGLVGVADDVREPAGRRVDVHRSVEHVGAVVEDRCGAVAVVGVDVDDRDPFVAAVRAAPAPPAPRC